MRVHMHLRRGGWQSYRDRAGRKPIGKAVSDDIVRTLGFDGVADALAEEYGREVAGWYCDGERVG